MRFSGVDTPLIPQFYIGLRIVAASGRLCWREAAEDGTRTNATRLTDRAFSCQDSRLRSPWDGEFAAGLVHAYGSPCSEQLKVSGHSNGVAEARDRRLPACAALLVPWFLKEHRTPAAIGFITKRQSAAQLSVMLGLNSGSAIRNARVPTQWRKGWPPGWDRGRPALSTAPAPS
jgi:hypothetical protein